MKFLPLFTLDVSHQYYGEGSCPDLDFVLAEHSWQTLNGARLLARVNAGKLHVLFEAVEDAEGKMQPMQDIAGLELLIGLFLRNPCFEYFTGGLSEPLPLYTNTTHTLNVPQACDLVERLFTPTAAMTQRPLTLSLHRASDDALMLNREVKTGEAMPTLDLHHWPAGHYRVTQQTSAGTVSRALLLSPDLAAVGIWGAVNLRVSEAFWSSPAPPHFRVGFQARKETLSYYVVAPTGWNDFDKLSVTASSLAFEKIGSDAFPPDAPSPTQLGLPAAQAVLFRSTVPVQRSASASLHVQLKRNGDTLVKNLPLPGADMPSARFVVHLSKP